MEALADLQAIQKVFSQRAQKNKARKKEKFFASFAP